MDTISTAEKIARLEKELAQLREKERAEKEEERAKAKAERKADLNKIKDAVKDFNKKHDENFKLMKEESHIWHDKMFGKIHECHYTEV